MVFYTILCAIVFLNSVCSCIETDSAQPSQISDGLENGHSICPGPEYSMSRRCLVDLLVTDADEDMIRTESLEGICRYSSSGAELPGKFLFREIGRVASLKKSDRRALCALLEWIVTAFTSLKSGAESFKNQINDVACNAADLLRDGGFFRVTLSNKMQFRNCECIHNNIKMLRDIVRLKARHRLESGVRPSVVAFDPRGGLNKHRNVCGSIHAKNLDFNAVLSDSVELLENLDTLYYYIGGNFVRRTNSMQICDGEERPRYVESYVLKSFFAMLSDTVDHIISAASRILKYDVYWYIELIRRLKRLNSGCASTNPSTAASRSANLSYAISRTMSHVSNYCDGHEFFHKSKNALSNLVGMIDEERCSAIALDVCTVIDIVNSCTFDTIDVIAPLIVDLIDVHDKLTELLLQTLGVAPT